MPCYQVNVISIEFKPQNANLLLETIKTLKWRVDKILWDEGYARILTDRGATIEIRNGQATGQPQDVNKLRFAYSQTVVDKASAIAKAKGWMVQKTGANKLLLRKGNLR